MSFAPTIFEKCVRAVQKGKLIERKASTDKEYHFQDWFESRLKCTAEQFDRQGRNQYPDYTLARFQEGYEIKALAYPGREQDYDCNSHLPCGIYDGREIFYVFGRYPKKTDGNKYPVLDLVICHGSFLNADNKYIHKNKNLPGFGSYGDIRIRDRKMYVAPTPFALLDGVAHHRTLILPANMSVNGDFREVGEIKRREADEIVVAYSFDLRRNNIRSKSMPNPNAGTEHAFKAYRMPGDSDEQVSLRQPRESASPDSP